ncbi:MAG: CoA transferase [Proteobacteria bacterium]|nr:CoA transferase [Pseudomonadota bacterium]
MPLAGVLIIEANSAECPLALRLATSLAGRIAADLGADVIKLEPPEGDPVRRVPPLLGDIGAMFAFLNAGKKSVTIAPAEEKRVLDRLFRKSDVAILDHHMSVRHGAALLPRVAAVISMFGAGVPSSAAASEFTVMALGGLLDIVGDPDHEPLRLGGHQLAYSAGLSAYAGIVAALCQTPVGDRREIVRVNLLDVAVWLNWKSATIAAWSGRAPNRCGRASEWQVIRCADGWVALVYQDSDWPALQELVGDPRLGDSRFQTRAQRRLHARELAGIIEQAISPRRRDQLREVALTRRVPLGPIWSPAELERDPQNLARDFLGRISLGGDASVLMPRLPVLWDGEAFRPGRIPVSSESVEMQRS